MSSAIHRAWVEEQADRAAAAGGINTAEAWANATRNPSPAMTAARDKLAATITARRKQLCTTDPAQRLDYVPAVATDVRATINRERARLGLPEPGKGGRHD